MAEIFRPVYRLQVDKIHESATVQHGGQAKEHFRDVLFRIPLGRKAAAKVFGVLKGVFA